MQHPRSVLQILRRHYARYTPELVEATCGISRAEFEYLADAVAENSGRDRTTVFAYALGWTQHQGGPQMIRTADRKSTRLNSSHVANSYAVFCLKKKTHK